jgi:hypothetical protein
MKIASIIAGSSLIFFLLFGSFAMAAEYSDPKFNFRMTLPSNFYDSGDMYNYSKYFSTGNKKSDPTKIGTNDVGLAVMITKDYSRFDMEQIQNNLKQAGIEIRDVKNITVNGVSATQQIEDGTKLENQYKGCAISTYFEKGGRFHEISMFSQAGCDVVNGHANEYNEVVNSFQD